MGRPPPPERGRLMPQPAVQSVRPAVPTPLPSFCSPRQSSSVPQLPHDGPSLRKKKGVGKERKR